GVRSSATPPARRRLDIRPAAISSIRRDRLPVWLEPAGAASPLAEAPAGGAAAAGGSGAAAGLVGVVEAVTEATDGGDHVSTQLLADAGDEDLDGVRIAVEVLVVDVLDQFGAADHLALVVHQVAEQLVFLRGQLARLAVGCAAAVACVELHRAGGQLRGGVVRGAADQGAQA